MARSSSRSTTRSADHGRASRGGTGVSLEVWALFVLTESLLCLTPGPAGPRAGRVLGGAWTGLAMGARGFRPLGRAGGPLPASRGTPPFRASAGGVAGLVPGSGGGRLRARPAQLSRADCQAQEAAVIP